MKHPSPEDWITYLYDEATPAERRALDAHLDACPACRHAVDTWRETRRELDADSATFHPGPMRSRLRQAPAVRLALAAALTLLLGAGIGRWSGPSQADVERAVAAVRSGLEADWRAQRREDLETFARLATEGQQRTLSALTRELALNRAEDRAEWVRLLGEAEVRHVADIRQIQAGVLALTRETDTGFRQAGTRFLELAAHLPSAPSDGGSADPAPNP